MLHIPSLLIVQQNGEQIITMFSHNRTADRKVSAAASIHITLFTQQFKIQMQCVQYATYNGLGGCSKARSALTTVSYKEKRKTSENKIK